MRRSPSRSWSREPPSPNPPHITIAPYRRGTSSRCTDCTKRPGSQPTRRAESRHAAIMSAEASTPSTSSPSLTHGTSNRPAPHATSSTGWLSATIDRKKPISGPSTLKFAHHRTMSPWCHVTTASSSAASPTAIRKPYGATGRGSCVPSKRSSNVATSSMPDHANGCSGNTDTLDNVQIGTRTRPKGTLMNHLDSEAVTADLQPLLVELIDLSLTGKQAHWNVTGPQFLPTHRQLDELVDDVRTWTDDV